MKTLMRSLLGLSLMLACGVNAYASTLPADATNVRDVRIFRNVSGGTTTSGTAFILQNANSDSNVLIGSDFGRESSLGLDVTTTTSADSLAFIGVQLDDRCVDDGLCRLVTYGPAIAIWNGGDNSDTRMTAVGTSTVAGQLGTGSNAGIILSLSLDRESNDTESNGDTAFELRWIWVEAGRE